MPNVRIITQSIFICFFVISYATFLHMVLAESESTVTATVSTESVALSITTDGIVAYGVIPLSSSRSTTTADLNDTQAAKNDGNIVEDFNIKGQNTTAWTLGSQSGPNQYAHKFCTSSCTTPPTNYSATTTGYSTLKTSIDPGSSQNFDLRLETPSTTTSYSQQSVNIMVQAIKHN